MDDREYSNVYVIPANYTDSGKLLGGMLETRNTIEAAVLVLLVGYPELMWLQASGIVKIVLITLTLLPLGIFALIGIGGDSLMQYVVNMIRFWANRRKLRFRRIGYRYDETTLKKKRRKKRPKKSGAAGIRAGFHSCSGDQERNH